MRKYRITISGKGYECMAFKLSNPQFMDLKNLGIEENKVNEYDIIKAVFPTARSTEGLRNGNFHEGKVDGTNLEETFVKVMDINSKEIIYEGQIPTEKYIEKVSFNLPNYLIRYEFVKGEFYQMNIETQNYFDIKKLTPVLNDISGELEIISDFYYDDQHLAPEFNDLEKINWGDVGFYLTYIDLPKKLEIGKIITHPIYGIGKIVAFTGESESDSVTILFPDKGEKTFILSYATWLK